MAQTSDRYKRPREDDADQASKRRRVGISEEVAAHYNKIQERTIEDRYQSTIIQMRSFNNWVKSVLIGAVVDMVRVEMWDAQEPLTILDIGVGKGGDLGKWSKHGIKHLIGFDIAAESLACCKSRFSDMRNSRRRGVGTPFTAEFYEADFTRERLAGMIDRSKLPVDVVSCQFSFHYCFESFAQVDTTLANIAECLRDGGYFFLTFPDAYNIVRRWKESTAAKFGNRIYQVDFGQPFGTSLPLFGAKYRFSLEGVVDCPEFLVYFPVLVDIAKRNGLSLVYKKTFKEIFDEHSVTQTGRTLLQKMSALETFPSGSHEQRKLEEKGEYDHAKPMLKMVEEAEKRSDGAVGGSRPVVGTLTKAEWEAASLYCAAIFKKTSGGAELSIEHDE